MFKNFLCQLKILFARVEDDKQSEEAQVLYDKIEILLYRPTRFIHLQVAKKLIMDYEKMMKQHHYPDYMVDNYTKLINLWNNRYKVYKLHNRS